MSRRKRLAFTQEYKVEVVELIRRNRKIIGEVDRELDMTQTAVADWVKRADADEAQPGMANLSRPESEALAALRDRVGTLETEREILTSPRRSSPRKLDAVPVHRLAPSEHRSTETNRG